MIYKMFDGRHIDLSRVVEIGSIVEEGGIPSYFEIAFQLCDSTRTWHRPGCEDQELLWAVAKREAAQGHELEQHPSGAYDAIKFRFDRLLADEHRKQGKTFTDAHGALLSAWKSLVDGGGSHVQQN